MLAHSTGLIRAYNLCRLLDSISYAFIECLNQVRSGEILFDNFTTLVEINSHLQFTFIHFVRSVNCVLIKMKFIKYWVPFILWACAIFSSSSLQGRDIPLIFPFQDIVFHFFVYMVFGLLLSRALNNSGIRRFGKYHKICVTILISYVFAATDEFHQQFVPGRICSGLDLFIDAIAIFFGVSVYRW